MPKEFDWQKWEQASSYFGLDDSFRYTNDDIRQYIKRHQKALANEEKTARLFSEALTLLQHLDDYGQFSTREVGTLVKKMTKHDRRTS